MAFKWYQRNGFEKVSDVSLYKLTSNNNFEKNSNINFQKLDLELLSGHLKINLVKAFSKSNNNYGGFEIRDLDFWQKKIKYHYYHLYNEYYLISNNFVSCSQYIIACINSYPGREKSIDVLEYAYNDEIILGSLLNCLQELGSTFEINKVRFPVNNPSSTSDFLHRNNFLVDGSFSILYNSIKNRENHNLTYRYFHFDYA